MANLFKLLQKFRKSGLIGRRGSISGSFWYQICKNWRMKKKDMRGKRTLVEKSIFCSHERGGAWRSLSISIITPINIHVQCNSTPYNIRYGKVVFYLRWAYNLFQNVPEWNLVSYSKSPPLIIPINTYTSCNSVYYEIFNIGGFLF